MRLLLLSYLTCPSPLVRATANSRHPLKELLHFLFTPDDWWGSYWWVQWRLYGWCNKLSVYLLLFDVFVYFMYFNVFLSCARVCVTGFPVSFFFLFCCLAGCKTKFPSGTIKLKLKNRNMICVLIVQGAVAKPSCGEPIRSACDWITGSRARAASLAHTDTHTHL